MHVHLLLLVIIQFINDQAPVPIKPWNGVRSAEIYGTKCPTLQDLNEMPQSEREKTDLEDCLNMAIYTTNVKTKDNNCENQIHI